MHAVFLPLTLSLYKQECVRSNIVDRSHALIIFKVTSSKHDFCNEHDTCGWQGGGRAKRKVWPCFLCVCFYLLFCFVLFFCLMTMSVRISSSRLSYPLLKFSLEPISNHIRSPQFMSLLTFKHLSNPNWHLIFILEQFSTCLQFQILQSVQELAE